MNTTLTLASSTSRASADIPLLEDQFIDMAFIAQYTGLTDKWFYKLIQNGEFPPPVKFGRSSRWLRSELEAWTQKRIQESRATSV